MNLVSDLLKMRSPWRSLFAGVIFGQAGFLYAVEANEPASFNRLFTTPGERALLEDARTLVGQKSHRTGSVLERKKIVSYKGVLRANDGSAVLFMDDPRIITNNENTDVVKIATKNDVVAVKDDSGKSMAMLKPGQSYSLESGKYMDYFEQVKMPASHKSKLPGDPGQTVITGSGDELLAQ